MHDDNISYGVTLSLVLDTETPRAQHALLSLQPCGNYTRSTYYLCDNTSPFASCLPRLGSPGYSRGPFHTDRLSKGGYVYEFVVCAFDEDREKLQLQDESGRRSSTLVDRKPNSRMRPRGDLTGSSINEHIRCRRPRRKIWHRERSQPASGPRPPHRPRSPAKIAADRFVYAVHSVWPPSIHKKAKRALRDARRRGVALRRPAPAPDASAECASERNGRFVGA